MIPFLPLHLINVCGWFLPVLTSRDCSRFAFGTYFFSFIFFIWPCVISDVTVASFYMFC